MANFESSSNPKENNSGERDRLHQILGYLRGNRFFSSILGVVLTLPVAAVAHPYVAHAAPKSAGNGEHLHLGAADILGSFGSVPPTVLVETPTPTPTSAVVAMADTATKFDGVSTPTPEAGLNRTMIGTVTALKDVNIRKSPVSGEVWRLLHVGESVDAVEGLSTDNNPQGWYVVTIVVDGKEVIGYMSPSTDLTKFSENLDPSNTVANQDAQPTPIPTGTPNQQPRASTPENANEAPKTIEELAALLPLAKLEGFEINTAFVPVVNDVEIKASAPEIINRSLIQAWMEQLALLNPELNDDELSLELEKMIKNKEWLNIVFPELLEGYNLEVKRSPTVVQPARNFSVNLSEGIDIKAFGTYEQLFSEFSDLGLTVDEKLKIIDEDGETVGQVLNLRETGLSEHIFVDKNGKLWVFTVRKIASSDEKYKQGDVSWGILAFMKILAYADEIHDGEASERGITHRLWWTQQNLPDNPDGTGKLTFQLPPAPGKPMREEPMPTVEQMACDAYLAGSAYFLLSENGTFEEGIIGTSF